jgi:hypothetical protein
MKPIVTQNQRNKRQPIAIETRNAYYFDKVVTQLTKLRWEFEVLRLETISAKNPIAKFINLDYIGQDMRVVWFPISNTTYILYEVEIEGLINALVELENW